MILVTGATGKIGSEVMARLIEKRVRVRAFVRDRSRGEAWQRAGVELQVGSFEEGGALDRALTGVQTLFLLSPARVDAELDVLARAADAGVTRVVKVSAAGAAADSPYPLARAHFQVERRIAELRLAGTILRPGMFAQNLLGFADSIRRAGRFFGAYGQGVIAPIDTRDIADVAVAALLQPAHAGSTYTLTGPATHDFRELASKLSAAVGRAIEYVDIPSSALREQLANQGLPSHVIEELVVRQADIAAGKAGQVSDDVTRVLGRPARTFDDFARDYANAFAAP